MHISCDVQDTVIGGSFEISTVEGMDTDGLQIPADDVVSTDAGELLCLKLGHDGVRCQE